MKASIQELKQRVLSGGQITREEALGLFLTPADQLGGLFEAAAEIRDKCARRDVDLCSIVNAKSGACSEDCGFCSQSTHFDTGIPTYPLLAADLMLKASEEAASNGATKFGIVMAKKGPSNDDIEKVCAVIREIKRRGRIVPDASLGILTREQAQRLAEAGMVHYNHNLESSRRHFEKVCTTHSYDERINTIRHVKEAGMKVCCGGIFNMGETAEDRVDLAFTLKDLEVDTIPINFLNPIPGTPMADRPLMDPYEALACIAVFRFIFPEKELRIAGGREKILGALQGKMFEAGANATMVGNYLTTFGSTPQQDQEMIRNAGYRLVAETAAHCA